MKYEICQIDAVMYDDAWTYNETWHLDTLTTTARDVPRAFRRALAKLGVRFYRGRTVTEYDGDVYEICDRKTGEPLFVAIPEA
jgi:NADPH-dependent 2,4-dienoyl-CoA reductase/sulfur reductase-like enzyme